MVIERISEEQGEELTIRFPEPQDYDGLMGIFSYISSDLPCDVFYHADERGRFESGEEVRRKAKVDVVQVKFPQEIYAGSYIGHIIMGVGEDISHPPSRERRYSHLRMRPEELPPFFGSVRIPKIWVLFGRVRSSIDDYFSQQASE